MYICIGIALISGDDTHNKCFFIKAQVQPQEKGSRPGWPLSGLGA